MAKADAERVLIVECPSASDLMANRSEGEFIRHILHVQGWEVLLMRVHGLDDLRAAKAAFAELELSALHLSAHGTTSGDGFHVLGGTVISWEEMFKTWFPCKRSGSVLPSIKVVTDVIQFVSEVRALPEAERFYRGKSDEAWDLVPAVFRPRPDKSNHPESSLLLAFRDRARPRYRGIPAREDLASWIQLAQHFRLPTRLLDWSLSPLVALFFACEDSERSSSNGMV